MMAMDLLMRIVQLDPLIYFSFYEAYTCSAILI